MAEPIKQQLTEQIESTAESRFDFAQSRQKILLDIKQALKEGQISAIEARRLQTRVKQIGALQQQEAAVRLGIAEEEGRVQASPAEVKAIQQAATIRTKDVTPEPKELQTARVQEEQVLAKEAAVKPIKTVEEAREEARFALRPVKEEKPKVRVVPQKSVIDVAQQNIRKALPAFAALSDITQQEFEIKAKPKPRTARVTTQKKLFGVIPLGKPTEKEVSVLDPELVKRERESFGLAFGSGKLETFDPEQIKPAKFLIFDEPSPKAIRKLEYRLGQKAGIEELKFIRSGKDIPLLSKEWLTSAAIQTVATPVRIAARPLSTIAAATLLLSTGGTLGVATPTQTALGLTAFSTAIGAEKERQAGTTGAKTAGTAAFALTAIAGTKAIKTQIARAKAKKDVAEYDINLIQKGIVKGRGTTGKIKITDTAIRGVSKKTFTLGGKPAKETFLIKDGVTERQIVQGKTTIKIKEIGTKRFTEVFRGGREISSRFDYISPQQTFRGGVLFGGTQRQVLFETQTATQKKIGVLEQRGGRLATTRTAKGIETKIDLKIQDIFKREVVATDLLTKTKTVAGGEVVVKGTKAAIVGGKVVSKAVTLQKPEFVFDGDGIPQRDLSFIETTPKSQLKGIDIIQPKVFEQSTFLRTGTGTVRIQQVQTPGALSSLLVSKRAAAQVASTKLLFKPTVTVGERIAPKLSLSLPQNIMTETPIVTGTSVSTLDLSISRIKSKPMISSKQRLSVETIPKQISVQRPKAKVITRTPTDTRIDITSFTTPTIMPSIRQTPSITQQVTTIPTGIPTVPGLKIDLGVPGRDIAIERPELPSNGGLLLPPIPRRAKGKKRKVKKTKKPSRRFRFAPSLTGQVFDIGLGKRADETLFTGFEIR